MSKGEFIRDVGKGVLCATAAALLSVLLFALVIKLFSLPSSVIFPVNQVIKAAALLLGCFFGVGREQGLFKGSLIGFFFMFVTYFLFLVLGGMQNFSPLFFLELLFGAVIGALGGILAVNIRK